MTEKLAKHGERVMLINDSGKRFLTKLSIGQRQSTQKGMLNHDDIIGQPLGRKVTTSEGAEYVVIEPTFEDLIKGIKRNSQIIYPEDIGRILLKLNIYPGQRVLEAGTGSGGLTLALARYTCPGGHVYSYDARPEMTEIARFNIERAGLTEQVSFKNRDIIEGFDERDIDALFLDVKEPWLYLDGVAATLRQGGFFGSLLPTTNQIRELLIGLQERQYADISVEETLVRYYKTVPDRIRPYDTMIGHTGYLVFARRMKLD